MGYKRDLEKQERIVREYQAIKEYQERHPESGAHHQTLQDSNQHYEVRRTGHSEGNIGLAKVGR